MKVRDWISKSGRTYQELAHDMEVSIGFLTKVAGGRWENRSMVKLKKLIEISNGEITWDDLYEEIQDKISVKSRRKRAK